jgi:hypothetical protein
MIKLPNPRPNNGTVPVTLEWLRSNTSPAGECWLWLGSTYEGYGSVNVGSGSRRVHVVAYELAVGPVPNGLVLDHLCRTPACCNPAHLEPVTNQENVRRGKSLVYVDGKCPRCGSEQLYKRRWGHSCAGCRRVYEQTPARLAACAAYDRERATRPERLEQRRLASARYNAKKRAERLFAE